VLEIGISVTSTVFMARTPTASDIASFNVRCGRNRFLAAIALETPMLTLPIGDPLNGNKLAEALSGEDV
jgi:hypothetical protein